MKAFTLLIVLIISSISFAQQGINYKALIRDDLGNVLADQTIGVQFQIREAAANGSTVYTETHTSTTDANGIIVLNIGTGTTTDTFSAIDWSSNEHWLNLQIDITGGTNYTDMSNTQFMAVPYALSAVNAATKIDDLSDGNSDTNGSSLFIGIDAGENDDGTSNRNVGIGYRALYLNTNGSNNTANGYQVLRSNTTGTNNSAFGAYSLYNNTTGRYNSANGTSTLFFNTTGDYNSANGYRSLYSNTEGDDNTAIGALSLNENTTGNDNTASGRSALENNTIGTNNTALGYYAMRFNTTGDNNTATGRSALVLNTIGDDNTATGYNALSSNTIGHRNVAIGKGAGANNLFGSNNVYIGFEAGSTASLSEDSKLYINNEQSITPLIYGEFDNKIIRLNGRTTVNGATTVYESSNSDTAHAIRGIKTHIGNSDAYGVYGENTVSDDHGTGVHGRGGRIGVYGRAVTTGNENYYGLFGDVDGSSGTRVGVRGQAFGSVGFRYGVYSVGDLLYTGALVSVSDRKLKSNIKTLINSMETIMSLKPSTYNFKERYQEIMLASDKPQFGFMAQDVQAVLPELVSENKYAGTNKGDPEITFLGINYIGLIPILTAGIQEQQNIIEGLNKRIEDLSADNSSLKTTVKNLISRVEKIETNNQ